MSPDAVIARIRAAGRRWHPGILAAYLGVLGLGVVVIGVRPLRVAALRALERPIVNWDNRWSGRVEDGERLLEAGRYEEAAAYLARLDSVFPARHVKHARDRERERVLAALGAAYQALDRKRLTLATYHRLVNFDSKNYRNYARLAFAALAFDEPELAHETFTTLLTMHPSHLPSLREAARWHYDAGRFDSVVGVWEQYRTARRWLDLPVRLGNDGPLALRIPVDGAWHDVWLRTDLPESWSGILRIDPGGWSVEIAAVELRGAAVAGGTPPPHRARRISVTNLDPETLRLTDPQAPLIVDVGSTAAIMEVRVRARMRRPMDPEWWAMLEGSFRNTLDRARFAAARENVYLTDTPPEVLR